jgi:adenylosuccinate lyase
MRANLESGGGLVFSQRVLLALVEGGMARDQAYAIVQEHALASLDRGIPFRAALEADPRVGAVLGAEALAACFTLDPALRHVDAIFARAGGAR